MRISHLFLILVLFQYARGKEELDTLDTEEVEACVSGIYESDPAITQTMSTKEIVRFCVKEQQWFQPSERSVSAPNRAGFPGTAAGARGAAGPQERLTFDIINPEQERLLRSLRSCRGRACLRSLRDKKKPAPRPPPQDPAHPQPIGQPGQPAQAGQEETLDFDDAHSFRVVRKEYRVMSDGERARFHKGVRAIKDSGLYALLIRNHSAVEAPGAHWGPAFLPFHREFLKQLASTLAHNSSPNMCILIA